jgi:Tol biopolymer transport system component
MLGHSIGPYEVQSLLGRGGMGEVYRARDTQLERDVALKVLPVDLGADSDRLGRFQREARLLAALQHQNIASIYGLEEFDGQPVLVMELADGDDLSVRLGSGPLDPDEVERIGRQLARGLEFAHERGIIHRDLKPANIKLGPDGRVKILDFGLARAYGQQGQSASDAPTMTQATVPQDLTRPGTVLGTAAYMSPEQARGYEVDRRTDIWAFGVMLFEMLTGEKLFAGETASDTMAAILREDPDFGKLPEGTPPTLVQVIRRCLEKDPQQRLRDIGEVRIALEDGSSSFFEHSGAGSSAGLRDLPPVGRPSRLPWVLVAVLVILLGGLAALGFGGRLGPSPEPMPLVQAQLDLPERVAFNLDPTSPGPVVVSPDGRHVAYTGVDSSGTVMLYVQTLAEPTARPISGTAGAAYPFWSPNSRELAFFHDNELARVDIAGGPVVAIVEASNGKGGSWSVDDRILFAPNHVASIHEVPATGGESRELTMVAEDSLVRSHRFPHWLPDGEHFIYLAWHAQSSGGASSETTLRIASRDGGPGTDLLASQTSAIYAGGSILHTHENVLMARPFSLDELEFTGPPRPVIGGVLALMAAHVAVFSATDSGVLAYVSGGDVFGQHRLHWYDQDGNELSVLPPVFLSPQGLALSPDGERIAVAQADDRTGTFDIWIYERSREVGARFTFEASSEIAPVWSHDGQWIAYTTDVGQGNGIHRKRASGAGQAEVLVSSETDVFPSGFSHDGRRFLFMKISENADLDLWLLDLDDPDAEPRPWRASAFNEGQGSFSPDDRWIAYVSLESGAPELFVESLLEGGGRYRISTSGGMQPEWAADMSAIYYVDATGRVMETAIEPRGESLVIGASRVVTAGAAVARSRTYAFDQTTGQFLVQRPVQNRVTDAIQLVTGWQNLLTRD